MRKHFTEEQIIAVLRQVEAGTPLLDLCRKFGVSEDKQIKVLLEVLEPILIIE